MRAIRARAFISSGSPVLAGMLVLAGALAAHASTPANSLVVNGSFEAATAGVHASITGWTPSVPCTVEGDPLAIVEGWWAADGSKYLEVNTGCAGNGIQQTITTEEDAVYTLVYAYHMQWDSLPAENHLEVRFDGVVVDTFEPEETLSAWQYRKLDVVASGTSAVLEFVSTSAAAEQGNLLDFVVLVPKNADISPFTEIEDFGSIVSVTCPADGSCFAVGLQNEVDPLTYLSELTASVTSIEDGEVDTTQYVEDFDMVAIECPTASVCIGIGGQPGWSGPTSAYVMIEDGVVGTPITVPGGMMLNDIACTGPTTCIAVGSGDSLDFDEGIMVVIEDGVAGTAEVVFPGMTLQNIACSGPELCVIGGTTASNDVAIVLIEEGVPGSLDLLPDFGNVQDIVCEAAGDCYVGGTSGWYTTQIATIHEGVRETTLSAFPMWLTDMACAEDGCVAVGNGWDVNWAQSAALVSLADGVMGPIQLIEGLTYLASVVCRDDDCLGIGAKNAVVGAFVRIEDGVAGPVQLSNDTVSLYKADCTDSSCTVASYATFVPPVPGFVVIDG